MLLVRRCLRGVSPLAFECNVKRAMLQKYQFIVDNQISCLVDIYCDVENYYYCFV